MLTNRSAAGYVITDNVGSELSIPISVEDDFEYFLPSNHADIKSYYEANGYVVIRGLISHESLDTANAAFDKEVLASSRYIYRQATANPERNFFTSTGFMSNAILNLQCLDPRYYKSFRETASKVVTIAGIQRALEGLFGEPGKLVQSMYFHGNAATWPHQDTYYLDSEQIGTMTAAWVAAENIAPGSGRFFIYPGSHKIDMQKNGGDFDIAFHHDRYKQLVKDLITSQRLECRAPALAKGDVLFWNAKTIHGSLPTSQPEHSRRSFTGHYIPRSHRFLQFQSRIKELDFRIVNGMQLSRPKDQEKAINRAILFVETSFPSLFKTIKKLAIRLVTSR